MKLILGDCLDKLKELDDNSIDSCVTDPPYGLSFMGKAWDYDVPKKEIWEEVFRVLKPGAHILAFFGSRTYHRGVIQIEDAGFEIRDQIMWIYGTGFPKSHNIGNGLGTALKPAHEPIVLARKPLTDSVMKNVIKYGTGALNIEQCRTAETTNLGRWPANLIHDGSEEVLTKFFYCAKTAKKDRDEGLDSVDEKPYTYFQTGNGASGEPSSISEGRKTSYKNNHPTVKPTELMRYLCRLITPPKGIVLDPFMGSGSTGKAAMLEEFDFVGIERDENYFKIAEKRIQSVPKSIANLIFEDKK